MDTDADTRISKIPADIQVTVDIRYPPVSGYRQYPDAAVAWPKDINIDIRIRPDTANDDIRLRALISLPVDDHLQKCLQIYRRGLTHTTFVLSLSSGLSLQFSATRQP